MDPSRLPYQPKTKRDSAVMVCFLQCAPRLPQLTGGHCASSFGARRTTCATKRRPRARPTVWASNFSNNDGNGEDDDPELSRRVFLAGISGTTLVTAFAAYRFVIGEDVESRVYSRVAKRFPDFFPRETTPEERRKPLNTAFVNAYFNAVGDVAVNMKLISADELHREEEKVKERAFDLFFDDAPVNESLSNPSWLNFVLYSRLHVISRETSPQSRLEFVDQLARKTMKTLRTKPLQQTKDEAREHSEQWLGGIRSLLNEFVGLGWISGFRIEDFDGAPGSSWQDESRSSLTVYSFDPVTMQAAQLIGEEQFEEMSPKLSGWIKAYLMDSGIKVSFEDYYLDDAYRPDPEQFKPSQLATQFDLSM